MNPAVFSPRSAQKRRGGRALAIALSLALASIAAAAEPAKRTFNVPAADAEKALKVFSEQARLEVLFPTALVSGVRTQSVSGDLPPREALTQMLAGTGLVAVQDDQTGALSLRRSTTEPAAKNVGADRSRAARPIGAADVAQSTLSTDGVVELSPFVVGAANDRGYQALNTLSGTRLNTKLEDLGSSITVVTKQQMEDTAVLDLNDVFLYDRLRQGAPRGRSLGELSPAAFRRPRAREVSAQRAQCAGERQPPGGRRQPRWQAFRVSHQRPPPVHPEHHL